MCSALVKSIQTWRMMENVLSGAIAFIYVITFHFIRCICIISFVDTYITTTKSSGYIYRFFFCHIFTHSCSTELCIISQWKRWDISLYHLISLRSLCNSSTFSMSFVQHHVCIGFQTYTQNRDECCVWCEKSLGRHLLIVNGVAFPFHAWEKTKLNREH